MTFEGQFNPHQEHPEVVSSPEEAMQPASGATKRALLDVITAKSAGGHDFGPELSQHLRLGDDENDDVVNIARYRDGAYADEPSRMARVDLVQWTRGPYSKQLVTNYLILGSPDGLQMRKYSQVFDPREHILDNYMSISAAATEESEEVTQQSRAQTAENEMGLSFVSEEEAKRVLDLIKRAHTTDTDN